MQFDGVPPAPAPENAHRIAESGMIPIAEVDCAFRTQASLVILRPDHTETAT